MNNPELYFVFDVESIGLHGEGYAVGWVVIDRSGSEIDNGIFSCPPESATGSSNDRAWCQENIPALAVNCDDPESVRYKFWNVWMRWKEKGALMFSDCGWPVEARFLTCCVDDNSQSRKWNGPYPIHEIASVMFTKGIDPLAERDRNMNELPKHNPMADARQSARFLIEALDK